MPRFVSIWGDHPELVELIAGHDPDAQQPNLLFAAVHYLLLGGLDHPLRYIYDGTSSLPVAPVFADAVLSNRSAIDELLRNEHTQTNEVGRSAVLALMLNDAHQRSQQALAWIDLGGKRWPQPEHRPVPHRLHDGGVLHRYRACRRSLDVTVRCAQRCTSDFICTCHDCVAGGGGSVTDSGRGPGSGALAASVSVAKPA